MCGRKACPLTMKSLVTKNWGLLLSFFLHPLSSMWMGSIQLASSLFTVIQEYLQKKINFWRVTPSLNKGPAVPALVSLAPGCRYRGVVSGRLQVLLGMASLPCEWEAALSRLYLSTPSGWEQRQLDSEKRMWIGMESEMVHVKVLCSWLHPASIPLFCAGWASHWYCAAVGHFNS